MIGTLYAARKEAAIEGAIDREARASALFDEGAELTVKELAEALGCVPTLARKTITTMLKRGVLVEKVGARTSTYLKAAIPISTSLNALPSRTYTMGRRT